MKVLIVSRIDSRDALAFAGKIRSILEKEGCDARFDQDTAVVLGTEGTSLGDTDADVVIVIGGDGTILRTIQEMREPLPVLGINWGEVGFLADLEPSEAC